MLQCFGVGMFCLVKFWCNDTLRGEVFHVAWFLGGKIFRTALFLRGKVFAQRCFA